MAQQEFHFYFDAYDSLADLRDQDAALLRAAQQAVHRAYAPYSGFRVAAVARLSNGKMLTGTNQENASFPAGICAERVLLSALSSLDPEARMETLAISFLNKDGPSDHPITPCGICRQSLLEYESRIQSPVRLLLGGQTGKIYILSSSKFLLPLAFTQDDIQSRLP